VRPSYISRAPANASVQHGRTALVNQVEGKTVDAIFGSPDNMKFHSCMTLFATLQPQPFEDALRKYFDGKPDPMTLELLHAV